MGWASRPSPIDGRDAHPTNMCKLFNSRSLVAVAVAAVNINETYASQAKKPGFY
ncbi:hypothetical protein QUB05_09270 [Microcoleus sp. F10-C6]